MILALLAPLAMQAADPVAGVWRGSSLCQVRPSACNDEKAVYHASKDPRGGYAFTMNKVVGGVEVTMGDVDFKFDPATATLTGVTYDRAHRPGTWTFTVRGNHMSGKLTGQDGTVLRRIEVDRAP